MSVNFLPTNGLAQYQSIKQVRAGEIVTVLPAGCYVKEADGSGVFRPYHDGMTARFQPSVGDFWVVYEDGYESLSPRAAFINGYQPIGFEHASDCATHSEPAFPAGECDCGAGTPSAKP